MGSYSLDNLVIDNTAAGLFRVNRRAFTDPGILALEQAQVFERCWIYAGHTSEISQPGDFRARNVAGRPIILARGSDGQICALLNMRAFWRRWHTPQHQPQAAPVLDCPVVAV